jgi:hypothetical protein
MIICLTIVLCGRMYVIYKYIKKFDMITTSLLIVFHVTLHAMVMTENHPKFMPLEMLAQTARVGEVTLYVIILIEFGKLLVIFGLFVIRILG